MKPKTKASAKAKKADAKPKKVLRMLKKAKDDIKQVAKRLKKTELFKLVSIPKSFKFGHKITGAVAIKSPKRVLVITEQIRDTFELGTNPYCRGIYEGNKMLGTTLYNTQKSLRLWCMKHLPECDIPKAIYATGESGLYHASDYTANNKKRCQIKNIKDGYKITEIEPVSLGNLRRIFYTPNGTVKKVTERKDIYQIESIAQFLLERTGESLMDIPDLSFEWSKKKESLFLVRNFTKNTLHIKSGANRSSKLKKLKTVK